MAEHLLCFAVYRHPLAWSPPAPCPRRVRQMRWQAELCSVVAEGGF